MHLLPLGSRRVGAGQPLMHRVLVLNATYEPLSTVSVQRAIVLLLKEKAEMVEAAAERWHAVCTTLPVW